MNKHIERARRNGKSLSSGMLLCDGCLPEVIRALTNPHRE